MTAVAHFQSLATQWMETLVPMVTSLIASSAQCGEWLPGQLAVGTGSQGKVTLTLLDWPPNRVYSNRCGHNSC